MVERGENGGAVLDTGGKEENEGGLAPIEEGSDAPNQADQEINKVINESGGTADPNGEAEVGEDGENGQEDEGAARQENESPKPLDPRIENIEKTLQMVREKLEQKPPEPQKPLSDEDWAKLEQEWGAPRSTIERVTKQNVQIVNRLTDYIDSKFAKLEFSDALNGLSREAGFSDAVRYKKEVTEFLSDYDPKHWTNPTLLKKAVYYSRGLNANTNVNKARTDAERNKFIAGKARPSSPGGGQRRISMPPLTPAQKEAAAMMPGGESEYMKFRTNGRTQIE